MRSTINTDPFLALQTERNWREQGFWPAFWIGCPDAKQTPFVTAYRLRFDVDEGGTARVHVSADERYELFLDGARLGRGPERGSPNHWYFETYDLTLLPGEHVLAAKVWAMGEMAPDAQMSALPGFLLAAEGSWGARLSTGVANWETKRVDGIGYHRADLIPWRGWRFEVDGARYAWGCEQGLGDGWHDAERLTPARGRWADWSFYKDHLLKPAALPEMLEGKLPAGQVRHVQDLRGDANARRNAQVRAADHLGGEENRWQALLDGNGSVTVLPGMARRAVVELSNYAVAYPEVVVSGGQGGRVEVQWAEALKLTPAAWEAEKGHRGEIEGKYFVGNGDIFLPDGGERRLFTPLWWMAGRYVEVYIEAGAQALTIESLTFTERRYPLAMHSSFSSSDQRLDEIQPILLRGMQICSNETFFDCAYYEEMMYAGDTRLECLVTYILTRDDRLPRKALTLYDVSRLPNGMTQSRFPCRPTQVISTFALWWVGMVHDYLYWRNDAEFVRGLLPGVRATIQGFWRWIGADGLLRGPEGWNTIDWVPSWSENAGVPPDGHGGVSGLLNWQLVYALGLYEDLERQVGDAEQSAWAGRVKQELAQVAWKAFYDEGRGILADDLSKQHYSEHTQIMAILSGVLDDAKTERLAAGLFSCSDLDQTTIYFSHYYLEACRVMGRMDKFFERMQLWFYLKQMGFKTPLEKPEPSRSDCHAWSSHPLFHNFATLLGVRPAAPGFQVVEIKPQPGSLTWAEGRFPHPDGGDVAVTIREEAGTWRAIVDLPQGIAGTFIWRGRDYPLSGQHTELAFDD